MKYYVNAAGRLLGGWDDCLAPPDGAIEVPNMPEDSRCMWDFVAGAWSAFVLTREEVEHLRLRAYADPILGSDRHFAEAMTLQSIGGLQVEIDAARAKGAARYAEIQAEHPWPG